MLDDIGDCGFWALNGDAIAPLLSTIRSFVGQHIITILKCVIIEGVMEEEADESAADGNTFVATPPSLEPRNEASSSEDEMVTFQRHCITC